MRYLKKSKILFVFRIVVVLFSLVNVLLVVRFIKSYGINDRKFSNYGVVRSLKRKNKKTTVYLKANYNVIGYIDKKVNLQIGDIISFSYELNKVSKNTMFNVFNYKNYLKSINVYGELNIITYKKVGYNKSYILRRFINNLIEKKKSKRYLKTFIMSDKSLIDYDIKNAYTNNGVLHMLCVSGFHVMFILELIKTVLRKLHFHEKSQNIFLAFFSALYLYLSSFPVALLRAFLFYFLNYYNRKLDLKISKNLIFALTINICLFNQPFLLFNTCFWYTFVLSFFLIKFQHGRRNTIFDNCMVSLMAFSVSMPLTIFLSYNINLLTIFINIFFLAFACYIIYPLCFLALFLNIFDFILAKISLIFEIINLYVSKINFVNIVFPKISLATLIILYLLLFIIFYRRNFKIALLYTLFLICLKYSVCFDSHDYIYFVDVGQGDMLMLVSNYHKNVTIIDTGGLKDSKYLSKNINTFLYSIGVNKIDNLILTHGDYDHMGEAINLVNSFKVEKVIFNCGEFNDLENGLIEVLDKKKINYYSCISELNIDNYKLYFLQTKDYDNENDNSNVIYTELNGYKFMFMGDASITTEKEILNKYNLSDIDVLKVGHHGSKTSSGKEFINEINPKYSVISVGKNNRYGHPNKEALDNLSESKIYRTDKDGSIMFKIKNNKLKIETCSP